MSGKVLEWFYISTFTYNLRLIGENCFAKIADCSDASDRNLDIHV